MAGLAVAISWRGDPSAGELVHRMLDAVPHFGGRRHVLHPEPGVALGRVAETESSGHCCVADVRLDNGPELNRTLGGPDLLSDLQLIQRGHDRWGTELADHLVGDFAFAVWDARRRSLYAARDCFGIRPLYYCANPSWLVVASEIESIIAAEVHDRKLDDRAVLDFLQGEHRHLRETLFAGVYRVLPGHWLLATPESIREERYWQPPRHDLRLRPGDCPREFRKRFRAAVADRMQGKATIAAHLSGGLDSSAIVCMADEIARSTSQRPDLHAISAIYPGFDCDEAPLIDRVVRRIQFPSHRWDGTEPSPLGPTQPSLAHPWGGTSLRGMDGDLRLARQIGAGVLLSGFGGDELLFERGVFRDLAAQGRWLMLLSETALAPQLYSSRSGLEFLGDALRATVPAGVRRAFRAFWPRPAAVAPDWLGPRLRPLWEKADRLPEHRGPLLADHTRRCLWEWLTSPNLWWSVELQVLRAARHGLEMRYPFLDRRLADFLLAVPYEQRLPHGRMKRLLRRAMTGLVPSTILGRREVTTFDCLLPATLERHRAELRDLFGGAVWLGAPYADQKAVSDLFQTLDKDCRNGSNRYDPAVLLKIAQLEIWLRTLQDQGTLGA